MLTVCQCTYLYPWRKKKSASQQKEQLLGSSWTEKQEGKRWHLTYFHSLRLPLASHQQALLVKHVSINNMKFILLNLNTMNSNMCSHKRLRSCKRTGDLSQFSCINEAQFSIFHHTFHKCYLIWSADMKWWKNPHCSWCAFQNWDDTLSQCLTSWLCFQWKWWVICHYRHYTALHLPSLCSSASALWRCGIAEDEWTVMTAVAGQTLVHLKHSRT